MNEIDLRRFDLNLLVVFDVLMTERSVTRAAERLGRTQSAISHSLSRLRDQFGDPLLLKSGVRMQPTPLALELIEQARPMLGGLQRVLSPQHVFDAATSSRVFRLAAPDFMLTLFADLMTRLRSEAPNTSVEWTSPREPTLLDVAEGLIDIAIVPAELRWPQGVVGESIGALGWRCFGRRGHAAFAEWDAENWARWPHLGTGRRRAGEPRSCRSMRSRIAANHRRLGTELFGRRPDPRGVRHACDVAGTGDERSLSRLQARQHGCAVSASTAATRDGLVRRPQQGSRPDLASRTPASDRQTQFCELMVRS